MNVISGICKATVLLIYSLYLLFLVLTKYQRADEVTRTELIITYDAKLLRMAGVKFQSVGHVPESVSKHGHTESDHGMVIVSNHVSFMDVFSLGASSGCRFIAKLEIKSWPIFGKIVEAVGTLFIDRTSRKAILQINDEIEKSLERKEVIGVFAEGTSTHGNTLLPIKTNLFAAPAKLGSIIQPVVLVYTSNGVPTERATFAGKVTLMQCLWNMVTTPNMAVTANFLEPFSAEGLNRHEIGKICEERMRPFIKEAWGDRYMETDVRATEYLKKVSSKK